MPVEPGLDESAEPEELLVADLAAIDDAVGHLRAISDALERTAHGLRGIEVGQWSGDAADAFRARFDESPARWLTGADAFADAATACDAFRRTVRDSRVRASHAVALYRSGIAAGQAAVADRNAAVRAFDEATAAAQAGHGPSPSPLPEFTDPGPPMLEQAVRLLDEARRDRDVAGAEAARVVAEATAAAPPPPSRGELFAVDVGDALAEGERLLSGIGTGAEDIVRTARILNPFDQWNVAHLPQYVDGLSDVAAGLVTAGLHPSEIVKGAVGTGWGSDPAAAAGRLIPGLVLGVATGGSGKAAEIAGRGARAGRATPWVPELRDLPRPAGVGEPAKPERPPPKTQDSPELPARATMNPAFVGEDRGEAPGLLPRPHMVKYFDDADREQARLTVHDGRLYDVDGNLFNSAADGSVWSQGEERSIFVMDGKGNLYVSNEQEIGELHHSSFLAGQPVAGAGEVTVHDGQIEFMSDQSGHYRPPARCLDQVLGYLNGEGVDLSNVEVKRFGR